MNKMNGEFQTANDKPEFLLDSYCEQIYGVLLWCTMTYHTNRLVNQIEFPKSHNSHCRHYTQHFTVELKFVHGISGAFNYKLLVKDQNHARATLLQRNFNIDTVRTNEF